MTCCFLNTPHLPDSHVTCTLKQPLLASMDISVLQWIKQFNNGYIEFMMDIFILQWINGPFGWISLQIHLHDKSHSQ